MEINNKLNYEYSSISKYFFKRKSHKTYLSQILLNTKNFLSNNNNFSKKSNEIKEEEKLYFSKNENNSEFPLIQSPKRKHNFHSRNNYSNIYNLKQLLFNSIKSENFKKDIPNSFSKDALSMVNKEEKKDTEKKVELILNELNSSTISNRNIFQNSRNNNLKYSFNFKTLCEITTNKRYNLSKLKEKNNKNVYNFSKNKLFREIILNEYSVQELNSEKPKSLGHYKYYNQWIKNTLLELKKEIPSEENLHKTFEKEYKHSKYNKPLLNLNSLSVSFTAKGKYHLFYIPFEFLPLFYYKNMRYLKFILASIFKFDDNFENINIDFDEIMNILSFSKEFGLNSENDKTSQNMKKNTKINFTSIMNFSKSDKKLSHLFKKYNKGRYSCYKTIICKDGGFTPNKLFIKRNRLGLLEKKEEITNNSFNNDNNKRKDKSSKLLKMKIEEKIKIKENNTYKCIYNKFMFKWKTPKYNYDIIVKAPEAIFQVGINVLKSYIDIELIFFLIKNNFKKWDFYISQYLFSYKEFNKKMEKLLSVKSMEELLPKELDSTPLLKGSLSTKDIKEMYNVDKKINNLNQEKIQLISDKSKDYEFIYTDEKNINYIKIFHNFLITSKLKNFSKNKFYFDFNFFHLRILNKILRIQGLKYFFKKLIYIDRQNLSLKFRYDKLSSLANEDYKILENHKPNKTGEQTKLEIIERDKDIIDIVITFPCLETVKYNNQNYENCFESDYNEVILEGISLDILDELCKNDYNEWPNILLKKNS